MKVSHKTAYTERKRATFASTLRAVREARKLTTGELADRAGVNAALIRNLEIGATGPSLDTLLLLCRALRVSPSFLLGWAESNAPGATPKPTRNGTAEAPVKALGPDPIGRAMKALEAAIRWTVTHPEG